MIMIFVYFTLGIVIGLLFRKHYGLTKPMSRAIDIILCLQLFILGYAIGLNKDIITNIYQLGLDSLLLAVGAIAGSILITLPIYHLFFKGKV